MTESLGAVGALEAVLRRKLRIMNTKAWYTAMAIALGAVVATACTVSTSDDNDDDITDLDDDSNTGGNDAGDDGGTAGTGGTSNGGAPSTGGSDASGGSAGSTEPAGTCDLAMNDDCATCLTDADKGFADEWEACAATYPCCEESARYVLCMQEAILDPSLTVDETGDETEPELYCYDLVLAGLSQNATSTEFNALADEALSSDADPSCYAECFVPAG
jgi:hypothetical protein